MWTLPQAINYLAPEPPSPRGMKESQAAQYTQEVRVGPCVCLLPMGLALAACILARRACALALDLASVGGPNCHWLQRQGDMVLADEGRGA